MSKVSVYKVIGYWNFIIIVYYFNHKQNIIKSQEATSIQKYSYSQLLREQHSKKSVFWLLTEQHSKNLTLCYLNFIL